MTSHEAHVGPGHTTVQPQALHELEIEARGGEPGARDGDEMGDRLRLEARRLAGTRRCLGGQARSLAAVALHPHERGGPPVSGAGGRGIEGAPLVQPAFVAEENHRVSPLHVGAPIQPHEDTALPLVGSGEERAQLRHVILPGYARGKGGGHVGKSEGHAESS